MKDNTFLHKKNYLTFSLLLFLLFAIRPVEATIYVTFPLIIYFLYFLKENKISHYQILTIIFMIFFGLTLLFSYSHFSGIQILLENIDPPRSHNTFYSLYYSLIVITIVLLLFLIKIEKNIFLEGNNVIKSFFISTIFITIWWLAFFSNLFEWLYRTSFGDVVSNMVVPDISIYDHINNLIQNFGPFVFYFLMLLFIACFLLKLLKSSRIIKEISRFEIIIISSIPLPLLFYFFTVQTSFRKIGLAMIIFLIFLIVLGLKNYKKTYFLNILMVSAVLIIMYSHIEVILKDTSNSSFTNKYSSFFVGKSFPNPVTISPNPHDIVISNLDMLRKKYSLEHITLPIDERSNPVDPFLLSIMAFKKGFSTNYPYIANFSQNLSILEKYDAALIINPYGKMIKSKEEGEKYKKIILSNRIYEKGNEFRTLSPNQKYTLYIQYLFSLGKLEEHGWKEVECFAIDYKYDACLIIKLTTS